MTSWDACQAPIDRAALRGRKCYVGMDLSQTKDLTALVAVFPSETGYDVLAHFFVPEERMRERSTRDRVPYVEWERQGVLQAIPGPTIRNAPVREVVLAWAAEFDVQILAHDSWNAPALVQQLEQEDGLICVPIRQTFQGLTAGDQVVGDDGAESAAAARRASGAALVCQQCRHRNRRRTPISNRPR